MEQRRRRTVGSLPADAQGKIAEREAQREQAVNQKFQEAANVRKTFEAELTEANANRDAYKAAIDDVLSLVSPVKPDPAPMVQEPETITERLTIWLLFNMNSNRHWSRNCGSSGKT